MARKNDTDPANFWRGYEEKCGEKVLAYALGQYISGWEEYETSFWGLVIATEGGFRFHHFPHESWIQVLSRTTMGGDAPTEKTIFIPRERIVSVDLQVETRWWKRLLVPGQPRLRIRYRRDGAGGADAELVVETEKKAERIVEELRNLPAGASQPDDPGGG
ncbi:MAG: hypothetical protein LBP32_06930 [Spirochaetaceae bacterium]|jgi:hypothetical protein|nr:hypothetical protein [Spirochaetaceae bacterium]